MGGEIRLRILCREASLASDVLKRGLAIGCLLNPRIGHPFSKEINKLFSSKADETVLVLVSLVVAHSDDQFGRLEDFIPDNGFLAEVQLAVVAQHERRRQVNATASRAGDRLHRVQWAVGSVTVQLAEGHIHDATCVRKVTAYCQLSDEGANELGSRSNVILADFIATGGTGGHAVHGRLEPRFDATFAVQVTALCYLVGSFEDAKADAADDLVVDFALKAVQIVTHGDGLS